MLEAPEADEPEEKKAPQVDIQRVDSIKKVVREDICTEYSDYEKAV